MFQAKTRPRFVTGLIFHRFSHRNEFRTYYATAPAQDRFIGQVHNVHDSKMDATNFSTVIIDYGNGRLFPFINCNLLP